VEGWIGQDLLKKERVILIYGRGFMRGGMTTDLNLNGPMFPLEDIYSAETMRCMKAVRINGLCAITGLWK
jgi:hypothetical protein